MSTNPSSSSQPLEAPPRNPTNRHGALSGVMYPGKNVMLGRGGESNFHSGNLKFREFARAYRDRYKKASKRIKPTIAAEVVAAWRSLEPPGRFLTRTDPSRQDSVWHDVGESLAIKRAIKTLGEKAQRERRAEKRSQGGERSIPTEQAGLSSATSRVGAASLSHLVRATESYHSDSSSSSSVRSGKKRKRKAVGDMKIPDELSLDESLLERIKWVEGTGSSSSSLPPVSPLSEKCSITTKVEGAHQGRDSNNFTPDNGSRAPAQETTHDPFVQGTLDPRQLPTAAQLAETVFDEDDHDPIL